MPFKTLKYNQIYNNIEFSYNLLPVLILNYLFYFVEHVWILELKIKINKINIKKNVL